MWFQDKSAKALGMLADRIRQDLVRRNPYPAMLEALGNRDRWTDSRLVQEDEVHHAYTLTSEFQSAVQKARQARAQAGFTALLSMLLAAAVMLILLATFLPNSIRSAQVANNASAASWLAQVNTAEAQYAGAGYGGYVQPYALSGSLQAQVAGVLPCANPMLLPGVIAGSAAAPGAPTGYTLDFINGAAAKYTCTGGPAAAYQNYSITLTPISKLRAGAINFFTCVGTGCDGQVHYASGRTAVESDPVWTTNIAAAQAGSGSGTGTSSGASLWYGVFSPTVTYPAGAMVTYAPGGSGTEPSLYINGTGNAVQGEAPSQDSFNWFPASTSAVTTLQVPQPTITGSFSGVLSQINGGPLSSNNKYASAPEWCAFAIANNCGAPSGNDPHDGTLTTEPNTYGHFYVSGPSGWVVGNGGGGYVQAYLLNETAGTVLATCTIPNGGSGCSQATILTIPGLTSLEIEFVGFGGQTVNGGMITWGITP